MATASRPLIAAIRRALRAQADPAKAGPMQAYMKSAMPYLGVQTPRLRVACRTVFPRFPLTTTNQWRATVLALWRTATYREERYAAIELSGDRRFRDFQTPATLPMYEEIVTTGAWWDYVDVVAIHRLGPLLRSHPAPMREHVRAWARAADVWKRRSAILCQLSFKRDTDLDLLYECIGRSIAAPDFFLRKAIGWALREYAKTDPHAVRRYVRAHRRELSSLSKREALKGLLRTGRASVP